MSNALRSALGMVFAGVRRVDLWRNFAAQTALGTLLVAAPGLTAEPATWRVSTSSTKLRFVEDQAATSREKSLASREDASPLEFRPDPGARPLTAASRKESTAWRTAGRTPTPARPPRQVTARRDSNVQQVDYEESLDGPRLTRAPRADASGDAFHDPFGSRADEPTVTTRGGAGLAAEAAPPAPVFDDERTAPGGEENVRQTATQISDGIGTGQELDPLVPPPTRAQDRLTRPAPATPGADDDAPAPVPSVPLPDDPAPTRPSRNEPEPSDPRPGVPSDEPQIPGTFSEEESTADCKRIYNERNCCAEDEKCERARAYLKGHSIRDISLDITPSFKPDAKTADEVAQYKAQKLAEMPARVWKNRKGEVVGNGTMRDITHGRVVVESEDGQLQKLALAELGDDERCFVAAWWGIPNECLFDSQLAAARMWLPIEMQWKASALCHKPLYFEEVQLERYGHTPGPFTESVVSGAHFFLNVAVLPYKMGINPPGECQYALGYYRPGSCAPWLVPPVPISVRAALIQASVVTGGVLIIP